MGWCGGGEGVVGVWGGVVGVKGLAGWGRV